MPRHIFLFTEVNQYSAEIITRQLLAYDRESRDEITMFINSPGGSVSDLFSIIDAMDLVQSPIRTVVIGMAASCAAVIAAHGDTRLITSKSEFMLHEVWSFMMGSYSEFDESFKRMDKQQEKLLSILANATGKSIDEIKFAIKKKDVYFDAKQAIAFGLADRVIEANEAQILKLSEGINVEGSEIAVQEQGLSKVEILKSGQFFHPDYGQVVITDQVLNKMVENFKNRVRGIDISFDYTHDNESGEKPAAFWIKSLEVCNKGEGKVLVAEVEFTPRGRQVVLEKEYRYASADFSIDYVNEAGKHFPYVLRGGTLTNRPFIKEMNPIKLSEYKTEKEEIRKMNKEALINALKEQGVDVMALQSESAGLKTQVQELQNQIRELSAMPAQKDEEIKALKSKLDEASGKLISNEKNAAFEKLLNEGKVVPSQKEKILSKFASAEELSEFYKDAPAIVSLRPEGSRGEGHDDALTEAEEKVVASGAYTPEQVIKNRSIKKTV